MDIQPLRTQPFEEPLAFPTKYVQNRIAHLLELQNTAIINLLRRIHSLGDLVWRRCNLEALPILDFAFNTMDDVRLIHDLLIDGAR
jgi:hypothetical protein